MSEQPPVALGAALAGTGLIEASAGTGKTWTISGLFLRLVVEKGLAVEQILTVTFTRAATAELRSRIRRKLQDMLDLLEGRGAEDAFCALLAPRLADAALAKRRLVAALAGFDDAAIFTIHGFCQRALADRAFSSGMPLRTEILADTGAVLDAVVQDFWRREIAATDGHGLPPPLRERFVAFVLAQGVSPQSLAAWARRMLARHGMRIDAGAQPEGLAQALAQLDELHGRLAQRWRAGRAEIAVVLGDSPHLNRASYKPASLPGWMAQMDAYFAPGADAAREPECFDKFTATRLAAALKKNGAAPRHAFFEAADELPARAGAVRAGFDAALAALRLRLLEHARAELPRRLREERLQAYDDLLLNLHAAIFGDGGERLAAALRSRYPAALIDEFQDTDPLQYDIFRRIYGGAGGDCALFLVGDPKQAIYSFRGADLFAYLAAAAASERRYELDTNQRSTPPLVAALNTLFQRALRPFRFDAIAYRAVSAAHKERAQLVEDGTADAAPLRLRLAPGGDPPLNKGEARAWAAGFTAAEIARLLGAARAGRVCLGDAPLRARDIAVLVNDHTQAAAVRLALSRAGIACAEQSRDSVFHTEEAEDLERLLLAVAEPQREALVRAALAGPFFGLSAARLAALDEDEPAWEARLAELRRYHELWRDAGFMRMLRRVLLEQQTAGRLAAVAEGERKLTNIFHLAELLHARGERLHGMEALINWLATRRREAGEDEEAQLRLESDENLVQVVTIHKSKGLEYPVTFCPFLWDGKSYVAQAEAFLYHDPASGEPVADLGSPRAEQARRLAREEELAERLRLAYVALTRAKNRCYLLWGRIKDAAGSPLAWLLHQVEEDAPLPPAGEMRARLAELEAAGGGALCIEEEGGEAAAPLAAGANGDALAARAWARAIPTAWRLASFSSLLHAAGEEWRAELPDHDQRAPGAQAAPAAGGSRFAFPRGAEAGTCLHGMLEDIDFSTSREAWREAIARQLARAGFPADWENDVGQWLEAALATPLAPAGFALGDLARGATLRELEFHLPLERADLGRMNVLIAGHGLHAPPLPHDKLQGYLKGFIDLVFVRDGRYYLADYKSNWLGSRAEDYARPALAAAMDAQGYTLQYLLYSVALHRWLASRRADYDYDRHFGGALYLFLRGMAPQWRDADGAAHGVFLARPQRQLIAAIDALLSSRSPGSGT